MTFIALLLGALATYRLALLVTADRIFDRPRGWLSERFPRRVRPLLGCPWCASIWLAGPVAAGAFWAGDEWWFQVPAGLLAFSAAAGLLADHASP